MERLYFSGTDSTTKLLDSCLQVVILNIFEAGNGYFSSNNIEDLSGLYISFSLLVPDKRMKITFQAIAEFLRIGSLDFTLAVSTG